MIKNFSHPWHQQKASGREVTWIMEKVMALEPACTKLHTTISCSACQHLTVCMLSLLSLSNLEITPTIYNPFTFAPSSQYQMTVESVINMKHSHMFPALLVSRDDTSRSEGYA